MTIWRLSCCQVDATGFGSPSDLRRDDLPGDVFTRLERAYCAGRAHGAGRSHSAGPVSLDGWAGRLAAKRAVADVIGFDRHDASVLRGIEILPQPRMPCTDPFRCQQGHPPAAKIAPHLDNPPLLRQSPGCLAGIDVSISHESGIGFAAALAVFRDEPADLKPSATRNGWQ